MDYDLNELSAEEIVELGYVLNEELNKTASADELDLNDLSAEEIVELGYYLNEEMSKEASEEYFDLNELSVEEFIDVASELEEEFIKEAGIKEQLQRGGAWAKQQYGRGRASAQRGLDRAKSAPGQIRSHYKGRYQRAMDSASTSKTTKGRFPWSRSKTEKVAPQGWSKAKALGREFSPELAAGGMAVTLGGLAASRRGD